MARLYVKDDTVNDLAVEVMKFTKAPNKTEAVRRALQHELDRAKETVPLRDRIKEIRDRVSSQIRPNPKSDPFDMKAFLDEQWEI